MAVKNVIYSSSLFQLLLHWHLMAACFTDSSSQSLVLKGASLKQPLRYFSTIFSPLLSSQNILQDLCCLDTGKTSPNSANTYQMERLKLSAFENHISKLGLPYFWVQWICGLNYLPNEEITCSLPDAAVSVKHFQKVVRAIKSRVRSRLSLHEQVSSLGNMVSILFICVNFRRNW